MLVLSRKVDQRIIINSGTDQEIVITVVGCNYGVVRLGISAPSHMPIHREEIQAKIDAKKRESP